MDDERTHRQRRSEPEIENPSPPSRGTKRSRRVKARQATTVRLFGGPHDKERVKVEHVNAVLDFSGELYVLKRTTRAGPEYVYDNLASGMLERTAASENVDPVQMMEVRRSVAATQIETQGDMDEN